MYSIERNMGIHAICKHDWSTLTAPIRWYFRITIKSGRYNIVVRIELLSIMFVYDFVYKFSWIFWDVLHFAVLEVKVGLARPSNCLQHVIYDDEYI